MEVDVLTVDVALVDLPPQPVAVVRGHVEISGMPSFLADAFCAVLTALQAQGSSPAGPPFARYVATDRGFDVSAGFPVSAHVQPAGRVVADELPGGLTARVLYRGDYAGIAATYDAVLSWLADRGYVTAGPPWESYLDGPEVEQPRTVVHVPCRRAAEVTGRVS